jgi:alanine-glyoxylate transaminase/serine-glyoxylate transaminase/serine-pyruvate transaminase
MSLQNGLSYLAIPGPSVMPQRVLQAMHRASPNIYTGELTEMVPDILADLNAMAFNEGHCVPYISNGHGVWEAALANTLSRGDLVLVLSTGHFAHGWKNIAEALGIEVEVLEFGRTAPTDPEILATRLAKDPEHRIKAVLCVHVDTSSSVKSDVEMVRAAIDAARHPALLMVDCIASFGCDRFEMTPWGVDLMITACQKGLMTPPGVGFVFYNDKADEARETANCVTHYWDWRPRTDPDMFYKYFDGTAPTHHLYGLREALAMISEEGLDMVWRRHAVLTQAIWAAIDHWSNDGPLALNVPDVRHRSHAVTTVQTGDSGSLALQDWCKTKAGLTLGIGLGMDRPDQYFRLGHMGHVNAHMILGVIATVEAGMKATGLAHAPGGATLAAEVIAAQA